MTTAYIAGKMNGEPNWGFDLFDAAAEYLTENGWTVFSPADMDRVAGFDGSKTVVSTDFIQQQFRADMIAVAKSDCIVLLENWVRSLGARHEAATALFCGLDFYIYLEDEDYIISVPHQEIRDILAQPMPEPPAPPPPLVICLGHLARTGKDEVADYLVAKYGFQKQGFTDALNAVLYAGNDTVREAVDQYGWEDAKDACPFVREAQQGLGLAAREILGENVWVDAVSRKWELGGRYVIKNVRFLNEVDAIHEAEGRVIRVDRPGYGPVNGHVSETALLDYSGWDAVIANTGDIEHLHGSVDVLMEMFDIEPV